MITVTINTDALTKDLKEKFEGLTNPQGVIRDKLLRGIAVNMGGEVRRRIHVDGLKTDGTDIGKYNDTDPIYVNPKDSPRSFKPEGKPRKTGVFKSGKKKGQDKFKSNKVRTFKKKGELFAVETKHTTKYFESYKSFRDDVGVQTNKVNLSLLAEMENDFKAVADDPIKTNTGYGLGFTNPINALKAEGQEERYGEIYSLTENEKGQVRLLAEDFIQSLGFR